jgi:hypothetical protein
VYFVVEVDHLIPVQSFAKFEINNITGISNAANDTSENHNKICT